MQNKNRIIPQMFDVRPVDQTGDLDWEKIQSVSNQDFTIKKETGVRKHNFEKSTRAYILGVGIENENAPIFHDPTFNLDEILEYEVVDDYKERLLKNKKRQLEEKQKHEEFLRMEAQRQQENLKKIEENNRKLQEELEAAAIIAEKKRKEQYEEFLRREELQKQEHLKRIAEENIRLQKEHEEAVLEQKRELEKQKVLWLKEELKNEKESWEKEEIISADNDFNNDFVFNKKSKDHWYDFSWSKLFFPPQFSFQFDVRNSFMAFASVALVLSLAIGGISYASKGFGLKEKVLGVSRDGFENLSVAIDDITIQNFDGSAKRFSEAYDNFSEASQDIDDMGGALLDITRFIPFASKVSSGKNAVEAGKHFSVAGKFLNEVVKSLAEIKNPLDTSSQDDVSLLDIFKSAEKNITVAKEELDAAQENIDKVAIDDLPEDKRDKFLLIKQKLPEIRNALDLFLNNSHIFVDLLGGNGPRKYLFLFQNNSEMRATGGFIGSYGLLDIANGHVKKFFVDGIFNPDGQLREKVVPPQPIQKISATWSMHDSNWFPNFPTSAKKAIYFYEKTGGPTADGIITFTPTVMQKFLEITGPIEMPDYNVTLNSKNFIEMTQYEVEIDYDKKENKPKKILADLAPILLEKLLSNKDIKTVSKTINILMDGLGEKHILLYSQDKDLQNIISKQGWSGEIFSTSKDYLSVINSNINGFKTDAVVQESIKHNAEIQQDGSIVDTVTITRKHIGGNSEYNWLNKVNTDYMRVYVPKGSKLLEVSGQTRETNKPPLDYDALEFKRDNDIKNEENNTEIDTQSGTRIYNDADKTVFANWVYVSPQESVTITYKYLLPFSLFKVAVKDSEQIDSYSLVAQKQSGSVGSSFTSDVSYPDNYNVKWSFPDTVEKGINSLQNKTILTNDYFGGIVFKKD